jgi:hypothetical protein
LAGILSSDDLDASLTITETSSFELIFGECETQLEKLAQSKRYCHGVISITVPWLQREGMALRAECLTFSVSPEPDDDDFAFAFPPLSEMSLTILPHS